jgi:predicted amidohydrolase YtcJ
VDIDLIVHNATVVTMDEAQPRARTLAVHHGRVLAVDPDGLHGRTEIDAQGAALVPGFGDAHNHMAWFGQGLDAVDLSGLSDLDTLYHRVAERAATLPGHAMVVGTGYDDTMIGGHPRRRELDRAAGGRPVWLQHRSGHVCTVNSPVLERIGVFDGSASAPTGGVVVTDGAGDPTGVLEEQAREAGTLGVRVQLMPSVDALRPLSGHPDDAARFGLDLGVRTGFGDERLRIGPMKIVLDGSLVARTAAMVDPFCDRHSHGYLQDDPDLLRARILDAHASGWRIAAHAIGDRAVDLALDALAEAQQRHPRPGARPRIEHAAVTTPAQIARMAELGVTPVPQPRFLHEIGDTMAAAIVPGRADGLYRHASFLRAGLRVPGSSDRPVASGAPLLGMQSMVERLSSTGAVIGPEERVVAPALARARRGGGPVIRAARHVGHPANASITCSPRRYTDTCRPRSAPDPTRRSSTACTSVIAFAPPS